MVIKPMNQEFQNSVLLFTLSWMGSQRSNNIMWTKMSLPWWLWNYLGCHPRTLQYRANFVCVLNLRVFFYPPIENLCISSNFNQHFVWNKNRKGERSMARANGRLSVISTRLPQALVSPSRISFTQGKYDNSISTQCFFFFFFLNKAILAGNILSILKVNMKHESNVSNHKNATGKLTYSSPLGSLLRTVTVCLYLCLHGNC